MMTAKTYEDCLELALEMVLNGEEDVKGRHKQIRAKLAEDRVDAAHLCVYILQTRNLNLRPWERPPCHSTGEDKGPMGRLVRRLQKHGISECHPDPLQALADIGAGIGLA
jgi:hypothetical protein